MLSLDERRNYRVIKSRYAESRGSYEIFSRIAEGGLWEKRTNVCHTLCHTPDERLLEFLKDIASMFLTIKYRDNLQNLKEVLKTIPEIENIEEDTYDVMWNFLDKRMLELKENIQNEDGGINMCGAVDQMIAEGMERGLAQGMERGLAQGTERGIKNLIEVCQELGTSYDNVQFQVEMKYNLNQEEAGKYMKQYWK